ncbi:MAG: M48 family metalloprotease [Alphaproteobacteria bacterium]|nr:M48 family metalloprotease [Alphaproteobacteria bacterium]
MKHLLNIFIFLSLLLFSFKGEASSFSIIKDTEIEEILLNYVKEIWKSAHLSTKGVQVILLNDKDINAFVIGGHEIFIHTGLILEADSADEVAGVLAHETGHILGSHTSRASLQMKSAQKTVLFTTLLGGLAAALSGRADVGIALMAGGSETGMSTYSAYRRSEEKLADSTAISLLQKTSFSPLGFLNIMKKINQVEKLSVSKTSRSYLRQHPITSERIIALKNQMKGDISPPKKREDFERMKAKLFAFSYDAEKTLARYSGASFADRYAQVIAYFKQINLEKSLTLLDVLIKEEPENPYLYELKAQILFETGKAKDSLPFWEKALLLKPEAFLIRMEYVHALLELNEKPFAKKALTELSYLSAFAPKMPEIYKYFATAYDTLGQEADIPPVMAEYYFLIKEYEKAFSLSKKALETLPQKSPLWFRMNDLNESAKKHMSKKNI